MEGHPRPQHSRSARRPPPRPHCSPRYSVVAVARRRRRLMLSVDGSSRGRLQARRRRQRARRHRCLRGRLPTRADDEAHLKRDGATSRRRRVAARGLQRGRGGGDDADPLRWWRSNDLRTHWIKGSGATPLLLRRKRRRRNVVPVTSARYTWSFRRATSLANRLC